MNLSQEFIEKMTNLLDKDIDKFLNSLNFPEQKGVTVNFSRLSQKVFENACNFSISPVEHVSNGFYVNNFKFANNIFSHMGVIYSQEPSAMYPVELLRIYPNDIILDVCASPGGKSVQILEKLNGTGLLVSNEINFSRNKILYENLSRMGFDNYIITCNSPEDLSKSNVQFDKILVDAPCGGEGLIRKNNFNPNAFSSQNIETNAKRQLAILDSIEHLLKPNGILVYSTCTYDIKENEMVIAKFLECHQNYQIIDNSEMSDVMEKGIKIKNYRTDLSFRRYPHKCKGEGQFMIALKKEDGETVAPSKTNIAPFSAIGNKEKEIIKSTLKGIINFEKFAFYRKNDSIFIAPKHLINFKNLNVTHMGVLLGTIKNNTLKLSHSFYHTYGAEFTNKLELSEIDIQKYLHGDEIDVSMPNGIYAITYLGVAIGGGKNVNGRLKNYYNKDLRI